jgi:hypothetical protein
VGRLRSIAPSSLVYFGASEAASFWKRGCQRNRNGARLATRFLAGRGRDFLLALAQRHGCSLRAWEIVSAVGFGVVIAKTIQDVETVYEFISPGDGFGV